MAIALNLAALVIGFASAFLLTFSLDPVVDVLARAASPIVVNVGRGGPDVNEIARIGMDVRTGTVQSRKRVRWGCVGLSISFALQAAAFVV